MRSIILLAIILAIVSSLTTAKRRTTTTNLNDLNKVVRNNPQATATLLSIATRADGNPNPYHKDNIRKLEEYDSDYNYHIAQYSIQFQGCHHIQQWNNEDYYEDQVRVMTKRLVRFRLIPYETCESVPAWMGYLETVKNNIGSYGDYGEYIIDLNQFVYTYLYALSEGDGSGDGVDCDEYNESCANSCGNDDADDECMNMCYEFYSCNNNNYDDANQDADGEIDPMEYAFCAQVDDYESYDDGYDDAEDDGDGDFYVGPYCAAYGAEIRMGLFSDDTCTTSAKCDGGQTRGASCYKRATGVALPYADESIVQDVCITCSSNYIALDRLERMREAADEAEEEFTVQYEFGFARDVCMNLYSMSGKCEEHMSDSTYDNGCEYIEGIKIAVTNEGVVMGVVRSGTTDIALGALAVVTSFLGIYLFYLNHVLNKPRPKTFE